MPAVALRNGKRGSIVKEAFHHLEKSHLSSDNFSAPCFLAADFKQSALLPREATVVIPLHNSSQAGLISLSKMWAWKWTSLDSLKISRITRHAQAAYSIINAMSTFKAPMPAPQSYALGSGAPFHLSRQARFPLPSSTKWQRLIQKVQGDSKSVIKALLQVPGKHKDYCETWADRVVPWADADIPTPLRGAALQPLNSSFYTIPFSHRYTVPETSEYTSSRIQPETNYRPTSLDDIVSAKGRKRLSDWLTLVARDLISMRENPSFQRKVSKPLVITEEDVLPRAKGIIWDLRIKHFDNTLIPQGYFKPLDMHAQVDSVLSHDWFVEVLGKDYPDKELLGFIKNGVSFKANIPLVTVLFPHSISLPSGFTRVEKEIKRFLDLKWYNETALPPFWPLRTLPQGVVERKLEANRPRRTTNGSAPHDSFIFQGETIKSTNEEIDLKNNYDIKWPREVKPNLGDVMHDAQILRCGAQIFGLPVFNFTDDAKDYYMHFRLHPSLLPFSCLLWTPLTSQTEKERGIAFISELVLGFGISASSNVAQRLSWAFIDAVQIIFDKAERPFFDSETKPSRIAWIKARDKLSVSTGREQCRLYNMHMYTDDPIFSVVGIARTVRLIICWREVTQGARLSMAVPQKRELGCGVTWNGCKVFADLGIVIVLPQKRMRALCAIDKTLQIPSINFKDYQSLTGFLQHLVVACGQRQEAMYGLFEPHRKGLSPNQIIWLTSYARAQLKRWAALLASCSGTSFSNVFQLGPWINSGVALIALYSDACKADADYPGIGGFAQGFWWRLSLAQMGLGHLNIPQLELIAFVINIIVFDLYIGKSPAICYSDSLTSTLVLEKDAASQDIMQFIHSEMLCLPTMERLLPQLAGAHIYGEANPMADYASRNMIKELCELCESLAILPHQLQVPIEAWKFIHKIKEYTRSPTDMEQMRSSAFSNNVEGDGPSQYEGFSPRTPLPSFQSNESNLLPTWTSVDKGLRSRNFSKYGQHREWSRQEPFLCNTPKWKAHNSPDFSMLHSKQTHQGPIPLNTTGVLPNCTSFLDLRQGVASHQGGSRHARSNPIDLRPSAFSFGHEKEFFQNSTERDTNEGPVLSQSISTSHLGMGTHQGPRLHAQSHLSSQSKRSLHHQMEVHQGSFCTSTTEASGTSTSSFLQEAKAHHGLAMLDTTDASHSSTFSKSSNSSFRHGVKTHQGSTILDTTDGSLNSDVSFNFLHGITIKQQSGIRTQSDTSEAIHNTGLRGRGGHEGPQNILKGHKRLRENKKAILPARRRILMENQSYNSRLEMGSALKLYKDSSGWTRPYSLMPCEDHSSHFHSFIPQMLQDKRQSNLERAFNCNSNLTPSAPAKGLASILPTADMTHAMSCLRHGDRRLWVTPNDPIRLCALLSRIHTAVQTSVPPNSSAQLTSAWASWTASSIRLGFNPWRDDSQANAGIDRNGFNREVTVQCLALLDIFEHMKPRRISDASAKPSSAIAVLSSVRRLHALRSPPILMVKAPAVSHCLKSLLYAYVQEHGPDALIPQRKEPISNSLMRKILSIPNGTQLNSRLNVDWTSLLFIGLNAAMCTAKQAGLRKAECTMKSAATDISKVKAMRSSVHWRIQGTDIADPSVAQFACLCIGDCALLTPPPSKADQFGMVWGGSPIFLPFANQVGNAAKALRDMEVAMPVRGIDRSSTFLFTINSSAAPLLESTAASILHSLLSIVTEDASFYSFHSFRIALACELKAAGASDGQIQALCRWRSAASLLIYARLNSEDCIAWTMKAAHADASSIRSNHLPTIDEHDLIAAISPLITAME